VNLEDRLLARWRYNEAVDHCDVVVVFLAESSVELTVVDTLIIEQCVRPLLRDQLSSALYPQKRSSLVDPDLEPVTLYNSAVELMIELDLNLS
jgi:hypothetical protein